jgi:phage gpG-like protein
VSAEIKINISAESIDTLRSLQTLPERMLAAMAQALDAQHQLTIAHISAVRMRGNDGKPFPPDMHVLGIRTAHLVKSLRAAKSVVNGQAIEGGIGTNVVYAGIHEFGGRIEHAPRTGKARLRTDNRGTLLRQAGYDKLAVFARKSHKRVKEVAYTTKAYTVVMPARAPISTGIEDRMGDYANALGQAIQSAWDAK